MSSALEVKICCTRSHSGPSAIGQMSEYKDKAEYLTLGWVAQKGSRTNI